MDNTFNNLGTFNVTCTVHNQAGDVTSQTIQINIIPVNEPPTANAGQDQIVAGCSVDLDGSLSSDDGTITTWSWVLHYIGDQCDNQNTGTENDKMATGETPAVTGLIHGHYIVTLTVTDNAGATSDPDKNDEMFLSVAADSTCDPGCGGGAQ